MNAALKPLKVSRNAARWFEAEKREALGRPDRGIRRGIPAPSSGVRARERQPQPLPALPQGLLHLLSLGNVRLDSIPDHAAALKPPRPGLQPHPAQLGIG